MERWPITREDTEYRTPIFTLHKRWVTNPEKGTDGIFYVLKCPDWVNVIAETTSGELVFVEQYRHGIDAISLEVPGGVIDSGENPEEAALRELEEETGFVAKSIEKIGRTSANAAILNNFTHTFWAKGCSLEKAQHLDENEQIRVHILSKKEVIEAMKSGKIHHAIVVAALGLWLAREM